MKMKNLPKALGLAIGSTALVTVTATGAFAQASSYNLTAGSAPDSTQISWSASTTGTTPQVHFTDVDSGAAFTCDSAGAAGTATTGQLATGTQLPGPGIGQITGSSWTGCEESSTGSSLTVTGNHPWALNATGDTNANGETEGTITGISAHVSADNGLCDFDVTGSVDVVWDNGSPSTLEVLPNPTLTISNTTFGCSFLSVQDGDSATFDATYKVIADNASYNPITLTSNP